MLKINTFSDHLEVTLPSGKDIIIWKLDPKTGALHYPEYDCGDIAMLQFRPSEEDLKGKLDWTGYSDVIGRNYKFKVKACKNSVMKYNLHWVL